MSEEKKTVATEEVNEVRKLTVEELKHVVGGNPGPGDETQASAHTYVPGGGCIFSSRCQAASKAECPFGLGFSENCPKST